MLLAAFRGGLEMLLLVAAIAWGLVPWMPEPWRSQPAVAIGFVSLAAFIAGWRTAARSNSAELGSAMYLAAILTAWALLAHALSTVQSHRIERPFPGDELRIVQWAAAVVFVLAGAMLFRIRRIARSV